MRVSISAGHRRERHGPSRRSRHPPQGGAAAKRPVRACPERAGRHESGARKNRSGHRLLQGGARETGGDDSVRAAASSNLGDLYRLQGNTEQAAEAYETAIKCLGPQGESRRLSRLHLRLGRLYRHLGQTDAARQHLSDSVRLFKDSGDEAGHVQSLAELGAALTESGLHDPALRHFEEAVRICLRTGDKARRRAGAGRDGGCLHGPRPVDGALSRI